MELDPAPTAGRQRRPTAIQINFVFVVIRKPPLYRPGWDRSPLIVPESADNAAVSTACRATMEEQDPDDIVEPGMVCNSKG